MNEKVVIKSEKIKANNLVTVIALLMTVFGCGIAVYCQMRALYDLLNIMYIGIAGIILLIPSLFISIYSKDMELVVTNRRIYGKAKYGKRVDLPLDSISSVEVGFLKGICVGTASGKIKFILIKNNEKIHQIISQLVLKRQNYQQKSNDDKYIEIEKLKKYKELFDDGVITQEEFEQKKQQLLDL